MENQWEAWRGKLAPVITSKAEEWVIYGHDQVTEEDVWNTFIEKMRRKKDIPSNLRLHWVVAELFAVSANDYMTQLTVSAYRSDDWFSSKGSFSLKDL
ncbi:post-transcriptional regulator [Alkalicoccus daliensis]|uniref:Post-transcriptional regulator n=1 Tax=Alkalicoccus daliensis TaxID=745820 RepID=A0A1H0BKN1_9BACI|nr:post-transcriptional regulator [Alkalicoccus daliensis]SDN46220.1 Post-transcriptional regulator [Alkalicoccus daliensis]